MSKNKTIACAAVATALMSASSAQADCFFYQHSNYEGGVMQVVPGTCVVLGPEGTDTRHCGGKRVEYSPAWNNQISSVRTTNGSSYFYQLEFGARSPGGSGQPSGTDGVEEAYVGDDLNDRFSVVSCE